MRYSSAGHPDQIHVCNNVISILRHTGKLIGIKQDTRYECVQRDINELDKILLYTDGLFEQYNDRDEAFTEQNIREMIEEHSSDSIRDLNNAIIKNMKEMIGGNEKSLRDDITLIGIEIQQR